jgi:hypothetical protein
LVWSNLRRRFNNRGNSLGIGLNCFDRGFNNLAGTSGIGSHLALDQLKDPLGLRDGCMLHLNGDLEAGYFGKCRVHANPKGKRSESES